MKRVPVAASLFLTILALFPRSLPAEMNRLNLSFGGCRYVHFDPDFKFPMNGIQWGGLYVHASGLVSFENPYYSPFPSPETLSKGAPAIAFLWTNLDPSSGGSIQVGHPAPDRFEVRFQNVPLLTTETVVPAPGNGEIGVTATLTLFSSGHFEMTYGEVNAAHFLVGWTAGEAYTHSVPAGPDDLSAWRNPIGTASDTMLYEVFHDNFDLAHSRIRFNPVGQTGGLLSLTDNHTAFIRFWNDFSFPFESFSYRGLWIGDNGQVSFGGKSGSNPATARTFVSEHVYIAPFWTDLDPTTGTLSVTMPDPSLFQIEWKDFLCKSTGELVTFRLLLSSTGHFEFDYEEVSAISAIAGFSAGHSRTACVGNAVDLSTYDFLIPDGGEASLLEAFTASNPVDISFHRFRFLPRQTVSSLVSLGDDGFLEVLFHEGFTFPFAGRKYDRVFVNANGNVTFQSGDFRWVENVADFLGGCPRIAPFWDDLNPETSGSVHVDLLLPGSVTIRWENVPEYIASGSNTAHLTLHQDGSYDILFEKVTLRDCITGHSGGGGVNNGSEPTVTLFNASEGVDRGAPAWYQQFTAIAPFNLHHLALHANGIGSLVRSGQAHVGQTLDLFLKKHDAPGSFHVVMASLGSHPGFEFQGQHVPLNPDTLFMLVPFLPGVFVNFLGQLDGCGQSTAAVVIPALPALVGRAFYLGMMVLTPASTGFEVDVEPMPARITITQ